MTAEADSMLMSSYQSLSSTIQAPPSSTHAAQHHSAEKRKTVICFLIDHYCYWGG